MRGAGERRGSFVRSGRLRCAGAIAAGAAAAAVAIPVATSVGATPNQYQQTNLISDIAGVARITDPNLVNPWGLSASPTSPLWAADNGKDVSTLYTGGVNGSIPQIVPLVVSIPHGAPTGTVFNPTSQFVVHTKQGSAPANFIFDSEAGRITAWSRAVSGTEAQVEATRRHAVYKGLAIAMSGSSPFIYAANFHAGRIDVFDGRFKRAHLDGSFTDPNIPDGYAPFNVQELGGNLYVTFAKQDDKRHDEVDGPGLGFVSVFDTSGHLIKHLISGGDLNAPWGLVLAPASFGGFGGDLLVGNFGDGTIHAYDPMTGQEKGQLMNTDNNPITIDGLWALRFGNGTFAAPGSLVFTAGIGGESHGLLGEINPAQ